MTAWMWFEVRNDNLDEQTGSFKCFYIGRVL